MLAVLLETLCCHCVTSKFVFSFAKKSPFILSDIETKSLWSRFPHEKLGVAQQVIIFYGNQR